MGQYSGPPPFWLTHLPETHYGFCWIFVETKVIKEPPPQVGGRLSLDPLLYRMQTCRWRVQINQSFFLGTAAPGVLVFVLLGFLPQVNGPNSGLVSQNEAIKVYKKKRMMIHSAFLRMQQPLSLWFICPVFFTPAAVGVCYRCWTLCICPENIADLSPILFIIPVKS